MGEKKTSFNQSQREAVLDLMIYASYADKKISLGEQDLLAKVKDQFGWESSTAPDTYINVTTAKIRGVLASVPEKAKFLAAIAQRLGTVDAKKAAYALVGDLFAADKQQPTSERNLAVEIKRAFGV